MRATIQSRGRLLAVLAVAAAVAGPAAQPAMAAPDREDALQAFNRDVHVLDGATLRNPTADTPDGAALYSSVGALLPQTWGEWRSASASSRMRTVAAGGEVQTDVRLALSGLVPGGVYSVFYGTFGPDSEHPLCPGVERTLPLTAFQPERQEPDPSSFVADSSGNARYHGRVDGALLEASQVFLSVVYHFDSMTYHPFPNRGELLTQGDDCRSTYGLDAMRQLLVLQKL